MFEELTKEDRTILLHQPPTKREETAILMMEPILNELHLPVWRSLLVTGTSIQEEQAKETIRRTDDFFKVSKTGTDKEYEQSILSLLSAPH
jgi:hypothetical protein